MGVHPSLRGSANMESMQYAEAVVKEFLLFRGSLTLCILLMRRWRLTLDTACR
ncbi:hypothetical protein Mapa_015083 [Marchantia paleacea]|nr:hypothetical protein Mapa_015083 [Marchantia paleacea]